MKQWLQNLILACFVLSVIITVKYYAQLPETMASHFDFSGNVNGTMSKPLFFGIFMGIFFLYTVLFLGLPVLLGRMPDARINLPNKDYWLDASRREQTIERIQTHITWWGASTMLFLLWIMWVCIKINFTEQPRMMSYLGWVILGYSLQMILSIVFFVTSFFRKPAA